MIKRLIELMKTMSLVQIINLGEVNIFEEANSNSDNSNEVI